MKSKILRINITGEESCATGFISWRRLAEALQDHGETLPNETIAAFELTVAGLEIRYAKRIFEEASDE